MAECLGKAPEGGAAGRTGPEPGGLESANASIGRSSTPAGGADCSRVGWTSATTRDTEAYGLGNGSAGGCSAGWRQALGGSAGLSFMR